MLAEYPLRVTDTRAGSRAFEPTGPADAVIPEGTCRLDRRMALRPATTWGGRRRGSRDQRTVMRHAARRAPQRAPASRSYELRSRAPAVDPQRANYRGWDRQAGSGPSPTAPAAACLPSPVSVTSFGLCRRISAGSDRR